MTTESYAVSPFPGLRPFRQDEDYLFFGREEQTMELMQRLGSNRFVAVVGTSGSGKSSLVRCGLLSQLQGGKMLQAGASWEIAVTQPGGNPLALLADAILDAELYDPDEPDAREHLLATLTRSHFGLVEAVKQAHLGEGVNFLLVVDQFEEIFRFNEAGQTQQEVANEFVSILMEAAAQQEVPIYIVLTMRSDFIGDCSQFEGLAEMVNRGEFLIPRLTREQYKRVIEAPIRVAGGEITPRLLQRLLNDLGQQSDQLPCLQHALMRTWNLARQRSATDPLDLEDYRQAGGMAEALSLHADEVYESLEDDKQRELCAEIFRALTVQETESRGIRRPQRLRGLCRILEADASQLRPIIEAFRQHGVTFLMPPPEVPLQDDTIIDISHESLMRVWARLRHWVDEEYEAAGIYRRLSESAALFEHDMAGLYRDPELGIAISWRESRQPNAAWASRYHDGFAGAMKFLDESEAEAARASQQREAARQRELEQARQLADEQSLRADDQKRAAGRFRWLSIASGAVALLAIAGFVIAAAARKKAVDSEGEAQVARKEAVDAAGQADEARLRAEKANVSEKEQRERAEQETSKALKAKKDLEVALVAAGKAKKSAESASLLALASQKKAEQEQTKAEQALKRTEEAQRQAMAARKTAEDAQRRAVADRESAVRDKLRAIESAELAKRREHLFAKLLPLLREHALDGVLEYAKELKPPQALQAYVDFYNLVMGEQESGAVAQKLLDLNEFDLQGIDPASIKIEISVKPLSLFTKVLSPAIALAERELAKDNSDEMRKLLARLYVQRARLMKDPSVEWPSDVSPANLVFESFDRAAKLQPDRPEHFVGRAAARFRMRKRDLTKTKEDLEAALDLYEKKPQSARGSEPGGEDQRQLARLHHARANVLEYLAQDDRQKRMKWLSAAEQAQRTAQSLDSKNPRYLVGMARTLRKLKSAQLTRLQPASLKPAEELLRDALKLKQEDADTHNELGEVYLLEGRLKDSRSAFQNAVKYGKQAGNNRRLFTYLCNLASVWSRGDAAQADYQQALAAAEQAIALKTKEPAEGHYYRGLALWKLKRSNDALDSFSESIRLDPKHTQALLARSQIVFEKEAPNLPPQDQLKQAYEDVAGVLSRGQLSTSDRAKASYVTSLGWLRYHVNNKSEKALVNCLDFSLQAARGSSAYRAFAKQVFAYAARTMLRDRELQKTLLKLQQDFKALPAN